MFRHEVGKHAFTRSTIRQESRTWTTIRRRPAAAGPDRRRRPSAAVALRVGGLPLCDTLTVVFHGRRDLGTIQTYVAHGGRGAGSAVAAGRAAARPLRPRPRRRRGPRRGRGALRRAGRRAARRARRRRHGARRLARAARGAGRATRVAVDRRIALDVRLPAHRLLPAALVAPEQQIVVTAVCGARPLAEGRPPMGIACAQQDVARVYPLPDDPERCLEDFLELAAEHARRVGRAARAPGGLGRSASWSSRGDDFHADRLSDPPRCARAVRRVPRRSPRSRFGVFVFLGISFLLARALTGAGAERVDACSTSLRAQARGDADAVLARMPACAQRAGLRARPTRDRVAQPQAARARSRSSSYRPSVQADADAPRPAPAASRGGRGDGLPVVQCVQVRRDGPLTGGGVELLVDLGADRPRGVMRLSADEPRDLPPGAVLRLPVMRLASTAPALVALARRCSRRCPAPPRRPTSPSNKTLYHDGPDGPLPDGRPRGCSGSTRPTRASSSASMRAAVDRRAGRR